MMARQSAFLPRLSLSRGVNNSVLYLYNNFESPMRKSPDDYNLRDLSPPSKSDDLDDATVDKHGHFIPPGHRTLAPHAADRLCDNTPGPTSAAGSESMSSHTGSMSKRDRRHVQQIMFKGPPPPIATSRILYRDEEAQLNDSPDYEPASPTSPAQDHRSMALLTGGAIDSTLFDRHKRGTALGAGGPNSRQNLARDPVWRGLQRREHALHQEFQRFLDVQSTGLAACLGEPGGALSSAASDCTPTSTSMLLSPYPANHRVSFSGSSGPDPLSQSMVVPVRQPRQKPLGLGAARAGLSKIMAALSDLKADEDAGLEGALHSRKTALATARTLAERREGVKATLRRLASGSSSDEQEVAEETRGCGDGLQDEKGERRLDTMRLRRLRAERAGVDAEIVALEGRLQSLKQRQRWLGEALEQVQNQREAGLSGYRGALRELDERVDMLLRRPPVRPLDVDSILASMPKDSNAAKTDETTCGVDFMRFRPERRTLEMARDWWEAEVAILERRKKQVDKDRRALEEGSGVWADVVRLVSTYEAELKGEISGQEAGNAKGKAKASQTPEQAMRLQLDKIARVRAVLGGHVRLAEEKGWNLLIAAVGAEYDAFKQAEAMIKDALKSVGLLDSEEEAEDDNDRVTDIFGCGGPKGRDGLQDSSDRTPHMAASLRAPDVFKKSFDDHDGVFDTAVGALEDVGTEPVRLKECRTGGGHDVEDKKVPRDLLAEPEPCPDLHGGDDHSDSRENDNEVPPEFLAEHEAEEESGWGR